MKSPKRNKILSQPFHNKSQLTKYTEPLEEFQIPTAFEALLYWPLGIKSQPQHKPLMERRFPKVHLHMTYKHPKPLPVCNAYSHLFYHGTLSVLLESSQSSISPPSLQVRKLRLREWELPKRVTEQSPEQVLCLFYTRAQV